MRSIIFSEQVFYVLIAITSQSEDHTMANTTFDPAQHLTKIKGQDYLEVKWRIAWLRAEHPDAVLSTELHSHDNGRAIFSAHVQLPEGGSATGWGSETVDTFENYIEKAETKAIGRALAAVGFGTQFCDDFNDTGAIADAPVSFTRANGQQANADAALATNAQKSMIQYKARQAQLEPQQLVEFIQETTGKSFNDLTKREASRVIDALGEGGSPQQMRRAS
jgi:pyruvoyl-dependent arginine decarboxylase (PvlArgDC)